MVTKLLLCLAILCSGISVYFAQQTMAASARQLAWIKQPLPSPRTRILMYAMLGCVDAPSKGQKHCPPASREQAIAVGQAFARNDIEINNLIASRVSSAYYLFLAISMQVLIGLLCLVHVLNPSKRFCEPEKSSTTSIAGTA